MTEDTTKRQSPKPWSVLHHIIMTLEVNKPIWKIIVATFCNWLWRVCLFLLTGIFANRLCYSLCIFYFPSPRKTCILCNFFSEDGLLFFDCFGMLCINGAKKESKYLSFYIFHINFVALLSLSIRETIALLHPGEGVIWPKMPQKSCKYIIPSPALFLPQLKSHVQCSLGSLNLCDLCVLCLLLLLKSSAIFFLLFSLIYLISFI